ncbi:protein trichome birefringence-like 14 [Salvia miltiorrhiza]|uniref:protein trichome birefringence-like 14 n=1 Tax=Salvia miltiorrhiza TaxID=226208 RepID=UPI0025AD27AE|nr:protein trichome birefringence-like 14 [Salvia miltiorrhiza]XP_057770152.1 protein trichome birefringence-like 14 [Salvia miltiorrhiza]XP_057770153.1 protein trichome birefringence-like 14 [Salvia miltiorrhiza]
MKGGQSSRFLGRHSSLTLAALFLTTIFFWSWENNPLLTSLLSAQDQFLMHASDFTADHFADTSVLSNPLELEKDSVSQLAEGTEDDNTLKPLGSDMDQMNTPSYERKDQVSVFPSKKQACNYGKGRWVADNRRPLYSGLGCKQWLSDMWACRLTQRTDFSYEGYRWQPDDCEMPEFQGTEFLRRMQDKTIAFIGDSLGRQQFQSLMCMASGGEEKPEVESVEWKFGLTKPRGAIRPDGWAYRFPSTNTTILYYWSASLCGIEPINITDPTTEYAMHLDRPPAFLERYLPQLDVVILNTGHHWNRGKLRANRWVMYAEGKPVINRKLAEMGNAKSYTLYSIARWFDSQIPLYPHLKVFLRTISPRHFANGEWNTGGSCDNLSPLSKGSEVFQNQSSDPVVEGAVRGTMVKILDITALSELRDEAHISHYSRKASEGINDCLHWCLPGIPDTWNELLYAQL